MTKSHAKNASHNFLAGKIVAQHLAKASQGPMEEMGRTQPPKTTGENVRSGC